MSRSNRLRFAVALAATLAAPATGAQDSAGFTRHAAHEHGKVTLNLAVEGGELAVEVESPALHVVGFEHAPGTPAERAEAEAAARWLKAGSGILGVPNGAGCVLRSAEVSLPEFGKAGGKGHTHDHDHGHDHEGEAQGAHADYGARYRFACRNPAALAWVEPWVLRRLRGVEVARINLISPTGQRQLDAREPATRIPLR
jgi:hypothetical protein